MSKMQAYRALVGAFVADAACMPTHWVYDHSKLYKEVLKGNKDTPEFHSPTADAFYSTKDFPGHYQVGQPSPYGEQAVMLVKYLATHGAKVDAEEFAKALLSWAKSYTGRKGTFCWFCTYAGAWYRNLYNIIYIYGIYYLYGYA